MAFDPSYFDKNPVTVRRQAGPTVSTGTQARGTQIATKPERNPVTRFGSFAADAFRAVVPQGVRNAIGAGAKLVDTPLSTRFGLAITDMPGPVDEVGNVLLRELTRPTNALVAFGGAGAAARLSTLGRAGRVAGALVAPISKGGKVQRLAAETAISVSARTGAETLNRGLDKLGVDSTPVRVAASIAGGLVGGVASVRAIEGATRGALGRDLLAIAPQPVRVKTTTPEAGQRIGNLLKARTIDQIGPDATVKDIVKIEARNLEAKVSFTANLLNAQADNAIKRVGKAFKKPDGNYYVRDANGVPQLLQDVLENPSRYTLTPDQVKAVTDYVALPTLVKDERAAFNVPVKEADLEMGQNYVPRVAIKNISDTARGVRPIGGGLTRGRKEPGRVFDDPLDGVKNGVVYDHPLAAFDAYTNTGLTKAVNNHIADLVLKFGVDPRTDPSYQAFKKHIAGLTARTRQARATLIRQNVRATTLGDVADSAVRGTERGAERIAKSAERLAQRQAAVSWTDIVEVRDHTSALITEGRDLARRIQSNIDTLRPIKGALRENDRALLDQVDRLSKQMNDAENANQLVSQIERTIQQPAENPTDAIYRQAQREYATADRRAGVIQHQIDRLGNRAAALEERVNERILKGETLRQQEGLSRAELVNSRRQEVYLADQNRMLTAAEREYRQLEREQARLEQVAGAYGARGGAASAKRAATGAKFDALRDELRASRAKWKDIKDRVGQFPPDRAYINMQVAPALTGRHFSAEDAKVITEFYTRGRIPVTQVEKAAAGARAVQRVVVPMRSTLDWSSTLNQLGIFLPSHPLTFVKNFVKAAGDMMDPVSYERFLAENAADATSHQIAILGRAKQGTEFEFGSWLDRVPGLHQANRHFQALTTRNRVDIYNSLVDTAEKSGKALTNVDKDQIGRSLNRLSGIATSRAGDLETLVEFAPNFVRSGIETFVKAGIDGSIEGSLARQYLRNMVISSQALAFGVAAAQGRDPREVSLPFDPKALAKGQIKLNPNFGTIRVGGQDISLYGRWDSLARLAITSMDSVVRTISEQNAARLMDAAGYGLLSKGSPLVSIASSFAQGATFAGNDPASLLGIAEQTLPFTISGFATDVFSGKPLGPSALGAGASALGAKANESTPFEQLNTAAQLRYNRDYDQLTGGEKQALDATVPNIAQRAKAENERRAARGDNRAQARVEFDKADQSRQEQEGQAYLAYQSGELSPEKFMDLISKYAFEAAKRKDQVNQTLGIEYDTPTDANAALSAWFKTFVDSEIAPGAPDFDVQAQLETELRTRIASGEFGDPGAAIATIDDRKKAAHPAEVQPFIDARERISDSGYYDLADVAFARFAGAAGSAAGEPVATYGGLQAAINRALRTGDIAKARRLKAIDERIQRVVARPKEMLRRRNPQLQADLSMTGAVSELSALSLALGRR